MFFVSSVPELALYGFSMCTLFFKYPYYSLRHPLWYQSSKGCWGSPVLGCSTSLYLLSALPSFATLEPLTISQNNHTGLHVSFKPSVCYYLTALFLILISSDILLLTKQQHQNTIPSTMSIFLLGRQNSYGLESTLDVCLDEMDDTDEQCVKVCSYHPDVH